MTSYDPITPRDGERFEPPADDGLTWYTIDQSAWRCHRTPRTIANLISKHQLPVRRGWTVARRIRRRRIMVPPRTLKMLLAMTLFREPKK